MYKYTISKAMTQALVKKFTVEMDDPWSWKQ